MKRTPVFWFSMWRWGACIRVFGYGLLVTTNGPRMVPLVPKARSK